jgi:hypothetical protein
VSSEVLMELALRGKVSRHLIGALLG